ncbi:MAG: glucose-6-phosphate isomerase family protein [Patescibacteria group bacterium]|nr:glucose-6-phosphate isomerase family protein [Patescibacteria group bacterium]
MDKKPNIRYLYDIKEVLYDKNWLKKSPNLELYYMYRGIKEKNNLRYDITVIPGQMLGKEFTKTKGHQHIGKFQEVYIVLEGQAIFLMQKYENNKIEDVYAIKSKKGDVVIIPSFYDHITINPLKKNLKIGNWVCKDCKNNYNTIEKMHGACYFYTNKGWIKNKHYKKIPKLYFKKPLKLIPKNLDFLKQG